MQLSQPTVNSGDAGDNNDISVKCDLPIKLMIHSHERKKEGAKERARAEVTKYLARGTFSNPILPHCARAIHWTLIAPITGMLITSGGQGNSFRGRENLILNKCSHGSTWCHFILIIFLSSSSRCRVTWTTGDTLERERKREGTKVTWIFIC